LISCKDSKQNIGPTSIANDFFNGSNEQAYYHDSIYYDTDTFKVSRYIAKMIILPGLTLNYNSATASYRLKYRD